MNRIEILSVSYQNNSVTEMTENLKGKYKYGICQVVINGGQDEFHITSEFNDYYLERTPFQIELELIGNCIKWIQDKGYLEPGGFIEIYTMQSNLIKILNDKLTMFNHLLLNPNSDILNYSNKEILNHCLVDHNLFSTHLKRFDDLYSFFNTILPGLKELKSNIFVKCTKIKNHITDDMKLSNHSSDIITRNKKEAKKRVLIECNKFLNLSNEQVQDEIDFRRLSGKIKNIINGIGFLEGKEKNKFIDKKHVTSKMKLQKLEKLFSGFISFNYKAASEDRILDEINLVKTKLVNNIIKFRNQSHEQYVYT